MSKGELLGGPGTGCFSIQPSSGTEPCQKLSCWAALHGCLPFPRPKPMLEWTKGKPNKLMAMTGAQLKNTTFWKKCGAAKRARVYKSMLADSLRFLNETIWMKTVFETVALFSAFLKKKGKKRERTFFVLWFFLFLFPSFPPPSPLHHISWANPKLH